MTIVLMALMACYTIAYTVKLVLDEKKRLAFGFGLPVMFILILWSLRLLG